MNSYSTKNSMCQCEFETGDSYYKEPDHAPYLHEDCYKCENELLKSIDRGKWQNDPGLLQVLSLNANDLYRVCLVHEALLSL